MRRKNKKNDRATKAESSRYRHALRKSGDDGRGGELLPISLLFSPREIDI